jgi:hypothetical protein
MRCGWGCGLRNVIAISAVSDSCIVISGDRIPHAETYRFEKRAGAKN